MVSDKFAKYTQLPDGRWRAGLGGDRALSGGYGTSTRMDVVCGACRGHFPAWRHACPHCDRGED